MKLSGTVKFLCLLTLGCLVLESHARAAPGAGPVRITFLRPAAGPLDARTDEYLAGARSAVDLWSGSWRIFELPVELSVLELRGGLKSLEKTLRRAMPHLLVGAPSGTDLDLATDLARRVRIPLILATPWEPRFTVEPDDPVFFFGGSAVEQAILAAGFTEIPLRAGGAATFHDGSPASLRLAEAYLRNLHPRAKPLGAFEVPGSTEGVVSLMKTLAEAGIEAFFVATDVEAAARLLSAKVERPGFLFADGLLVPELTSEAKGDDRFLVGINPFLSDDEPDRLRITREEEGLPASPAAVRGYAAACLAMRAFREAEGNPKGLTAALHSFGYEKMLGATIFTEWGQARSFGYELWEAPEGRPTRIKPTYLPTQDVGRLLRHPSPDRFRLDPGGMMVLVTWGGQKDRSIEKDLASIGLSTRGYEGNLDEMVREGVLARALARLNRLFWRNADGTPIPGVSFRITFGTELPERVKRQQWWEMRIAGDDPVAGGRASGSLALVFSTFIERTMYRGFRLDPGVRREDLDFFTGQYDWGSVLEKNIRHDEIRALMEGFAGALAMTGAHEIGHLAGLSHDTASDRSIMNVEEGGGLEPSFAEWVPAHVNLLETRLKRHVSERGRR